MEGKMDAKKELKNFMKKKNAEARGEVQIEEDKDEGDTLKDRPRAINQEAGEEDTRAAKALAKLRTILNAMLVIPIVLMMIGLIAYVLLRFLPSAFHFVRNLVIRILTSN